MEHCSEFKLVPVCMRGGSRRHPGYSESYGGIFSRAYDFEIAGPGAMQPLRPDARLEPPDVAHRKVADRRELADHRGRDLGHGAWGQNCSPITGSVLASCPSPRHEACGLCIIATS